MVNQTENPSRIYIEPTNFCNLGCRTCMRNVWDEHIGFMSLSIFKIVAAELTWMGTRPTIFFGGFGEPLAHPDMLTMLDLAKHTGCSVELISNATMLDTAVCEALVELGIDRLWVSLDGSTPDSYADIRLGDELPGVKVHLADLNRIKMINDSQLPRLGIAFVAMKRNIHDLPEVIRLGRQLGADQFSISNVLPHTDELRHEMLYQKSLYYLNQSSRQTVNGVMFPRMDKIQLARIPLDEIPVEINPPSRRFQDGINTCPFQEKNSLSIRWDGKVSPCLPLMHTHRSYLDDTLRISHEYSMGDLSRQSMSEIWSDPKYVEFRERLKVFDFSPCTVCNSCNNAESNLEDCFGNIQPACGGCLWAQGFIQCP